jgi:hypothetical protein
MAELTYRAAVAAGIAQEMELESSGGSGRGAPPPTSERTEALYG